MKTVRERAKKAAKGPTSSGNPYVPGEFTGHEEPEIDIERGMRGLKELEARFPKFKAMMDRLRAAARAVSKGAKMLLLFL